MSDGLAASDHRLLTVTRETVARALEGFPIPLLPDRDMDWLTMAVRRALAIAKRDKRRGPERTSNADIRADLERLAELAGQTWLKLVECDLATDDRIHTIAWRHWDGEGGNVSEPQEYRRYRAALVELEWLAGFLHKAAMETESPKGSWRAKERRWLRIERGRNLAPIFEAAYGKLVSANNWPSDKEHEASAFMDFYQRLVALAFGENVTPDLSGVLKEVCQRHRQDPVQFDEGVIPGL